MNVLVDIVNMNGEASCLSSARWLAILKGGEKAEFYQWLYLYIKYQKKVTLGLTGTTIVDVLKHNPESIELINDHPAIFEMVVRPFTHDIALLRSTEGFERNIDIGLKIIKKEFKNVSLYFLPPEFMLTNEQLAKLSLKGIKSVFINSTRFPEEIKNRIPARPYEVLGVGGIKLGCITIDGTLTDDYLRALHYYSSDMWNKNVHANKKKEVFSWRDGESPFLIPDGLHREKCWLKDESTKINRKHLKDLKLTFVPNDQLGEETFKSYPIHSFSVWMEGLRMLGFLNRVHRMEEKIYTLKENQLILWLHVIGSDILSAVEKKSPIIKIKLRPDQKKVEEYVIQRSERGFEGEEYLYLLEHYITDSDSIPDYISSSQKPHLIKLRNKIEYLNELISHDKVKI